MSLSLSTLLLFVILSPGFLFRFFINHFSLVKRVIVASDALHSAMLILIYSMIVHIAALAVFSGVWRLFNWSFGKRNTLYLWYDSDFVAIYNGYTLSFGRFLTEYPLIPALYFGICLFMSYLTPLILNELAKRTNVFGRLLFGPLSSVIGVTGLPFVTAFILTNVTHQGKRLIYAGFAHEVGIREGSKIDYVILRSPEKFYLKLTTAEPKTTRDDARQIEGLLFLESDHIENVHFQGWIVG